MPKIAPRCSATYVKKRSGGLVAKRAPHMPGDWKGICIVPQTTVVSAIISATAGPSSSRAWRIFALMRGPLGGHGSSRFEGGGA